MKRSGSRKSSKKRNPKKHQYIVNPLTNRKCRVDSVLGRRIIKNYKHMMSGGAGGREVCPICLEPGTPDNPLILGCENCGKSHLFHESCITQAIGGDAPHPKNRCPLCRSKPCRQFQYFHRDFF